MNMTPEQVDDRSQLRSRINLMRIIAVALVGFVILLFFGLTLQKQQANLKTQQTELSAYTHRMCEQRKLNVIKTNANWTEMARIESHNRFIDNKLRAERLALYRNAHLKMPDCDQ